jgi:hypothetical protein
MKSLRIAERTQLENWMSTTQHLQFGVAEKSHRVDSLCFLFRMMPGEFYIFYHEAKEAAITVDGRGVHSPYWIAPWGIAALREADFSELDASLKALDSDVYSIPFAVMKNVGIPVRLVLGQSESTEMLASLAEPLIEHGRERERLRALP